MTSLTPPGRSPHSFTYNAGDLTTAYNPPDVGGNGSTSFAYNLAKQPTLVTRPDGQTIGFEYDTRGRLLKLLVLDGSYTYAYHVVTGNLSGIVAPNGDQMLFTYDGSLPLSASWDGVIDGSVSVTYNNDFQVVTQSVNGANSISFTYDNDGLLKTAGALTLNWNLTNGMLTGTTLGNITDAITPNIFGELSRYQAFYSGSSIFDVQYGERDKLGRITTKTETIIGETHNYAYVYDPNTDRLTDVYKDGTLVSRYEYDENGNRLKYTGTNGAFTGVYDAQDRLLSYGNHTYEYIANGELARKTGPEGQTQYVYDVLGALRLVILPDGKRIEYVIDAQNRRVGRKVNGVLTQGFLYQDGLAPVAELNASGQIVSRFVNAIGVNVPEYMIKAGITYRIITDHLGSPRLVINTSNGEVAQRLEYDEFGNVITDTNPGFQPFGYAGGLYDRDTKLVRFGARDYDPEVGRWTCKDPIGFEGGSANLYVYCYNDSINYFDPSGTAYEATMGVLSTGWGLAVVDGPFPVGDAIYVAAVVATFAGETFSYYGNQIIAFADYCSRGGNYANDASQGKGQPNNNNSNGQRPNIKKVGDKYLKQKNIDAHQLKKDIIGNKAEIKKYDIFVNKDTGELWIFQKGGIGEGIPTGEFLR